MVSEFGWFAAALAASAAWWWVPPPPDGRWKGLGPQRSWFQAVPGAPGGALRLATAAAVTGPLVVALAAQSGLVALSAGGCAGLATWWGLGRVRLGQDRREAELVAGLPLACDLLAVAVGAGVPLRSAVEIVASVVEGPVAGALADLAAKVRLGIGEPQAWQEFGAEPALAAVGREVARAVSHGTGVAEVLRSLAVDARASSAGAAQVKARRVGVRSVLPLMACFLPAFVLLGIVPIVGSLIARAFG